MVLTAGAGTMVGAGIVLTILGVTLQDIGAAGMAATGVAGMAAVATGDIITIGTVVLAGAGAAVETIGHATPIRIVVLMATIISLLHGEVDHIQTVDRQSVQIAVVLQALIPVELLEQDVKQPASVPDVPE